MILEDLYKIRLFQTNGIAQAGRDPDALESVYGCLRRFYAGGWGELPPEDVEANNADLAGGFGRIVAKYDAEKLPEDIFIICYFDKDHPGDINYNNTTVMFVSEY